MTRLARIAIAAALGLGMASHAWAQGAPAGPQSMRVVKSPSCGCCADWIELAREHGHDVEAVDVLYIGEAKRALGVPEALRSCHTARIGGYVVEGHVPFEALDRLLAERPDVAGIAVPGMPVGSPGMGTDPDARYDVIAWGGEAGDGEVFLGVGE